MEVAYLRSFCTTVTLGSITKAANRLDIAQSRVSSHIKNLETELGVALLDRTSRPARPTPYGLELAHIAASHIEAIDSLRSSIKVQESELPVTVVAHETLVAGVLFDVVSEFNKQNPASVLRIRTYSAWRDWRFAGHAEADMAMVLGGPFADEDFVYTPLFKYDRIMLTPVGHPILKLESVGIEEIASWPLILTDRSRLSRTLLESEFLKAGVSYELAMELPSLELAKRYVEDGIGLAIGTSLVISPPERERFGVVNISNIFPPGEVALVTERGRTLSAPAQKFFDLAAKVLTHE